MNKFLLLAVCLTCGCATTPRQMECRFETVSANTCDYNEEPIPLTFIIDDKNKIEMEVCCKEVDRHIPGKFPGNI